MQCYVRFLMGECFIGYCQCIVGFFYQIQCCQMINEDCIDMFYVQILIFGWVIIIGMYIDVLNILLQLFFIVGVQIDFYFFVFQIIGCFNGVFVIFFYQCLNIRNGVWG